MSSEGGNSNLGQTLYYWRRAGLLKGQGGVAVIAAWFRNECQRPQATVSPFVETADDRDETFFKAHLGL